MLNSVLNECIAELKDIKEMETASNDTKRQEKIDGNFSAVVSQNDKILRELNQAFEKAKFTPSQGVINLAKDILGELEKVVKSGNAKDSTVAYLTSECKKLSVLLAEEWKNFYSMKSEGLLNLLETVIDITPYKQNTQFAINKIKKGSNWNTDVKNLEMMQNGLSEATEIISALGLDEKIIAFLRKVSEGKATLVDVTMDIMNWIEREKIASRLAIKFTV